MGASWMPDLTDPTGRRGWMIFTGEDAEREWERMLRLANHLMIRSWDAAFWAWVRNEP